jgi:hypothetical protein
MLTRGTVENDIQFDFVGRGLNARRREKPLGDGTRESGVGLRDGGGKGAAAERARNERRNIGVMISQAAGNARARSPGMSSKASV